MEKQNNKIVSSEMTQTKQFTEVLLTIKTAQQKA